MNVCSCLFVYVYMYVYIGDHRVQKRTSDLLAVELQAFMNYPLQVLGTDLGLLEEPYTVLHTEPLLQTSYFKNYIYL